MTDQQSRRAAGPSARDPHRRIPRQPASAQTVDQALVTDRPGDRGAAVRTIASRLTLCSIGSHSALDVAAGARAAGLRNLIVTASGREQTYARHFLASRRIPVRAAASTRAGARRVSPTSSTTTCSSGCSTRTSSSSRTARSKCTCTSGTRYDEIERRMRVPLFGNRRLLRAEERDEPRPSINTL